jgi:hypothetical protein
MSQVNYDDMSNEQGSQQVMEQKTGRANERTISSLFPSRRYRSREYLKTAIESQPTRFCAATVYRSLSWNISERSNRCSSCCY